MRNYPSQSGDLRVLRGAVYLVARPVWVKYRFSFTDSHVIDEAELSALRSRLLIPSYKDYVLWLLLNYSRGRIHGWLGTIQVVLSLGHWSPLRAPYLVKLYHSLYGSRFLRSPDCKKGLSCIRRLYSCSRVKSFRLSEALSYSYLRDMRFVLFICALLGISIWWHVSPPPLFEHYPFLCSPDLPQVGEICRDTFVKGVCSVHDVPSPCSCGEPLNSAARNLIVDPPLKIDPLELSGKESRLRPARLKSASVLIGFLLLTLTLSESVSPHGVYVGF